MTKVYFVRHAQPEPIWDDENRPLTREGKEDSKMVLDFLKDKEIDVFYSSPYKRSFDTISDTAVFLGKRLLRISDFVKESTALTAINMVCLKSGGMTMTIMRKTENPSAWCRKEILRRLRIY